VRPTLFYAYASCAGGALMNDNIVRRPASRGAKLDAKTAQAYTELLAQTIGFLDEQIERAGKLLDKRRRRQRFKMDRRRVCILV
jgi:hypothetical protein